MLKGVVKPMLYRNGCTERALVFGVEAILTLSYTVRCVRGEFGYRQK